MPPQERQGLYRLELAQPADQKTLSAVGAAHQADEATLLAGSEADVSAWRLLEFWSDEGLPFNAFLTWTGAKGGGQRAAITVPGSARICIYAKSIGSIRVLNLCDTQHNVHVAAGASDSAYTCDNHFMLSKTGGGIGLADPIELQPPPYAVTLRIDPADPAAVAATVVELYDGEGRLCASYALTNQPTNGMTVVGIRRVVINVVAAVRYRIDFGLGV